MSQGTDRTEERPHVRILVVDADDYIPKPFTFREVEARLRAKIEEDPSEPHVPVTVREWDISSLSNPLVRPFPSRERVTRNHSPGLRSPS